MVFDPHLAIRPVIRDYFTAHSAGSLNLIPWLDRFYSQPSYFSAKQLLHHYFCEHQTGDIESLRQITAVFADKRVVRAIVQSILDDEEALHQIAKRSYPHPIGFDKLVLHDDVQTGFKFRLHIYWRGANFAALERLHLHRFEMASAIITGELTNHLYHLTQFQSHSPLLPAMTTVPSASATTVQKTMYAYAGYYRDPNGILRKTYLGKVQLEHAESATFTSGDSYAQLLEDAHFVETNAETGFANGDFCSTIYIHGPSLKDANGRTLPILFEEERLSMDDGIISTIPCLQVPQLREQLLRYRDILDEILRFYDWLYDPKHGRNLSTGMIAGYLLAEAFQTPHVIDVFEKRYEECKAILEKFEQLLLQVLNGVPFSQDLDDRQGRYLRLLTAKAHQHADGVSGWLRDYGSLTKEMWRYFGAIRGELNPKITVLKPIWERVVQRKLPGGMHYGHIGAMIEAVFDANRLALQEWEKGQAAQHHHDYHITCAADGVVDQCIQVILLAHYPQYGYCSEEQVESLDVPTAGARRFLVDPIDGTRNFIAQRPEFAISIACQIWQENAWQTTDAVVAQPTLGRIFWAEKGAGAFIIDRQDREMRLQVQPKPMVADRPLHHVLVDFSARGLGTIGQSMVFRFLSEGGAVLRNTGCVALILAQLANRGGEAAILTAKLHDVAAGLLIAQEAGCDWVRVPFEIAGETRNAIVASYHPKITQTLQELLLQGLAASR